MAGYWTRHRLVPTLIVTIAVALIAGLLFVFPCIDRQAANYNSQSLYKNTDIDFIAPEPSEEQVAELPGTNGIDKVFPYYLTKTQISVNGKTRTTTVLLSDQFQNIDITMYNDARLVEKSSVEYENPIYVDWQFTKDTAAVIGDTVSLTIGGNTVEYRISAIYETNAVYDGGAILAPISAAQKDSIMEKSTNSGYSGMYVSASDYSECLTFFTTDYRPMGRLKDRSQFDNDEQYQIHYDAIMSTAYANEITDFRVLENSLSASDSSLMIWLGALLAVVVVLVFNAIMSRRGCEKGYFRKHCIPKGQNVSAYYAISFIAEMFVLLAAYIATLVIRVKLSNNYIPGSVINIKLLVVPVAMVIAEVISLGMNKSMLSEINRAVKIEMEKETAAKQREEMNAEKSEDTPTTERPN